MHNPPGSATFIAPSSNCSPHQLHLFPLLIPTQQPWNFPHPNPGPGQGGVALSCDTTRLPFWLHPAPAACASLPTNEGVTPRGRSKISVSMCVCSISLVLLQSRVCCVRVPYVSLTCSCTRTFSSDDGSACLRCLRSLLYSLCEVRNAMLNVCMEN